MHRKFRNDALLGWIVASVVQTIGLTLRISLDDRARVVAAPPERPMIWAFWHNSLFAVTLGYRKFLPSRRGVVLTSASKDGAILAAAFKRFGVDAVRGSSSRRGAAALLGLVDWVGRGLDVAITPDGPRGPRCELQPGIIKLAQVTGAPILPIRAVYHRAWELKTWDRFIIPYPFSRVDIVFEELQEVAQDGGDEGLERNRLKVEQVLQTEQI